MKRISPDDVFNALGLVFEFALRFTVVVLLVLIVLYLEVAL